MGLADIPIRIAQLASLHCGDITFRPELMRGAVERVNSIRPDLVVVAGDLTASGYQWEYDEAVGWLEKIEARKIVVPGNHDSKNVGYVHFEMRFGERFARQRLVFDEERAERVHATGVTIVAVDSSQPDLDEGHIGRE